MNPQGCRCDGHDDGGFVPESAEAHHRRVMDSFEPRPRGAPLNPSLTGAPDPPQASRPNAAGGLSPDTTAPAVPPLSAKEAARILGADATTARFHALLGSVLAIMAKSESGRVPLNDDNRYHRCKAAIEAVIESVLEEMVTPFAERFGLEETDVSELADTVIRDWFKKSTPEAVKWMDLSPEASSRAREHCGIEGPCSKCHGAGLFGCAPAGCDRCKGTGKEPKDEGQEAVK